MSLTCFATSRGKDSSVDSVSSCIGPGRVVTGGICISRASREVICCMPPPFPNSHTCNLQLVMRVRGAAYGMRLFSKQG